MKSLKSKLMAAGAMLMVSVVMLTSASFAWFTVSTAPEAANVKVQMGASKNLEIAKPTDATTEPDEVSGSDAGDETKWGGKVTTLDGTSVAIQFPAQIVDGSVKTIQYDSTGRTNGVNQVLTLTPGTVNSGTGVRPYTATINNGLGGTITKVVAVGIPVWLRTNVQGGADVALSQKSGASVTVSATGGATGASRTFEASDLTYGFTLSETFELKKADGTQTIHLAENTPTLVEVIFAIDGDKLVAADFTENANLKLDFSGVDLQFTSNDVA